MNFEQDMSILYAWNDKQYTAHLAAKREQILSDSQKPKVPGNEDLFLPLPAAEANDKTGPIVLHAKSKVRTRGKTQATQEDAEDALQIGNVTTASSPTRLTISVSMRS